MIDFIKLTREDGCSVYIAVDKIEALVTEALVGGRKPATLVLTAAEDAFRVVESVENILKALEASWYEVKR